MVVEQIILSKFKGKGAKDVKKVMSGQTKGSNQRGKQAGVCRTGAHPRLQKEKARQASEASAGR